MRKNNLCNWTIQCTNYKFILQNLKTAQVQNGDFLLKFSFVSLSIYGHRCRTSPRAFIQFSKKDGL